MNKGFIISITTLYYVVLFLSFLAVVIFVYNKPVQTDYQEIQNINSIDDFISYQESDSDFETDQWCSRHIYYDPNNTNTGYNDLEYKTYCVSYDGKRFV